MSESALAETIVARRQNSFAPVPAQATDPARRLVRDEYDFVLRNLQRLGLPPAELDDALQQVFLVAVRRLPRIAPGSERAFLYSTVLRVASIARRTLSRRREAFEPERLSELSDEAPTPHEALEHRRARERLQLLLDEMDGQLRAVFVLCELEELTIPEIAELFRLPTGTVASRLRRARQAFCEGVKRQRARFAFGERFERPDAGARSTG